MNREANNETGMKPHKEFTFGWLIFAIMVPIQLVLTYFYLNKIGDRPITTTVCISITVTFLLMYFLFYGLTTEVNSQLITISFGIGLIRKRIQLNRITIVETVKSPWYYGWGIRIIPNGMLYNISGSDGVELKFNDTKRIIRIGTKDSVALKGEIEKRLRP
jgi:hypothetical protein